MHLRLSAVCFYVWLLTAWMRRVFACLVLLVLPMLIRAFASLPGVRSPSLTSLTQVCWPALLGFPQNFALLSFSALHLLARASDPKCGPAQAVHSPQRVCLSSPASRQRTASMATAAQASPGGAAAPSWSLDIVHLATTRWYLDVAFLATTRRDNSGACHTQAKNVVGGSLEPAGPNCGFYRDGYCFAGADDGGVHAVCAEVRK